MASITDEKTIIRHGYSLFPTKIGFDGYVYLLKNWLSISRAYGITILVTVSGTFVSLLLMAMMAYPLSRPSMPFKKTSTFFVFFTMLFNGGLVPTYLVYTQIFDLKNNILSLVIPFLLVRAFYILIIRTFFTASVPDSIIESANMDGATEFITFYKIVLPLSIPVLATIGLFQAVGYWNDWFNGMIFITDSKLYSIQNMLNRILMDLQYLASSQFSGSSMDMSSNMPQASIRMAIAVVGILPIFAAYPFFQKYFVKGLTIGAVKG
jgi:putative aldouronate transport system permease protein